MCVLGAESSLLWQVGILQELRHLKRLPRLTRPTVLCLEEVPVLTHLAAVFK